MLGWVASAFPGPVREIAAVYLFVPNVHSPLLSVLVCDLPLKCEQGLQRYSPQFVLRTHHAPFSFQNTTDLIRIFLCAGDYTSCGNDVPQRFLRNAGARRNDRSEHLRSDFQGGARPAAKAYYDFSDPAPGDNWSSLQRSPVTSWGSSALPTQNYFGGASAGTNSGFEHGHDFRNTHHIRQL